MINIYIYYMDSKILNLFSFLNSNENRYSNDVINSLNTIDDFKKFENIPKEFLDILVYKFTIDENKELINYLKSIGGTDDFFKHIKKWMDKNFKNLNSYISEKNPNDIYYGNSKDDITFYYNENYQVIFVKDEYINTYFITHIGYEYLRYINTFQFIEDILYMYFKSYLNHRFTSVVTTFNIKYE